MFSTEDASSTMEVEICSDATAWRSPIAVASVKRLIMSIESSRIEVRTSLISLTDIFNLFHVILCCIKAIVLRAYHGYASTS